MTLTVVTPWFGKRAEFERDYWAAMRAADVEVLVIDNGSTPPLPNGIRLPMNLGFSQACNVGLAAAVTDAVLFLNNDIRATAPDWGQAILDALEPGVLVGANLRYDRHGAVDGDRLPYLDGWCLAGMRDDLLSLGGFDEGYEEPAYYSDNDLCFRARLDGMTLREVKVGLEHKLNGTAGRTPEVEQVTLRNQARFRSLVREALVEA